jgi:hypothetical protein
MRTYHSEAIDSIQSWLVGPSRTRDSDCLEESNFAVILTDLGGEGDNVQVHRFGHWACGWYELILIRPETPEAASWAEWEGALANYPVASDEDFREREEVAANETWRCYSDHRIHAAPQAAIQLSVRSLPFVRFGWGRAIPTRSLERYPRERARATLRRLRFRLDRLTR